MVREANRGSVPLPEDRIGAWGYAILPDLTARTIGIWAATRIWYNPILTRLPAGDAIMSGAGPVP
ncbi:hypothetical protein LDL36_05465 [Komagataeibacter sp. FNDCR1]|nr:hypothetical protein [Komagataeibacter sp. FNDCR1]